MAERSEQRSSGKPKEDKIKREFDPGSESTLAARLTHASRARKGEQSSEYSGARVSNTWIIYLEVGNNPGKPGLRPHTPEKGKLARAL